MKTNRFYLRVFLEVYVTRVDYRSVTHAAIPSHPTGLNEVHTKRSQSSFKKNMHTVNDDLRVESTSENHGHMRRLV